MYQKAYPNCVLHLIWNMKPVNDEFRYLAEDLQKSAENTA